MDENNIDGQVPCPPGKANEKDGMLDEIPEQFRASGNVEYCFKGDAYYAFGNMANAMVSLKDYEAASFFL